jgi:hypothetical protein
VSATLRVTVIAGLVLVPAQPSCAAVISGIIQETFVTLRRAWDGNQG